MVALCPLCASPVALRRSLLLAGPKISRKSPHGRKRRQGLLRAEAVRTLAGVVRRVTFRGSRTFAPGVSRWANGHVRPVFWTAAPGCSQQAFSWRFIAWCRTLEDQ